MLTGNTQGLILIPLTTIDFTALILQGTENIPVTYTQCVEGGKLSSFDNTTDYLGSEMVLMTTHSFLSLD